MKTIFTLIIGLMFSFVSFGQQASCNANFDYSVDTNAMTVQFTDYSWGSDSLNPQTQATSWNWQINGVSYTTQNLTYSYTSLPFVACLTASFDNGCESTFCDSVYVEASDPCANYFVEAGYDIVDPGVCDGEISVNVYSGTAPYSYDWGSFGTNATISGLCEGNYPVTVIDANGCTGTSTGYVAEDDSSSQVIDSLYNPAIDTCINFTVVDVYVSNIVMIDSTSFQVEWTFVDDQQVSHIFFETYTFSGQYGNYYVEIAIDCNGNKVVSHWGDVIIIDDNVATGITTIETVSGVSIYPNPVKNVATIEYNLAQSSNVTISIIDYSGKVINTTSVNSYKGNNTVTLSTSELNSGVYFARIVSDKTVKTIKFIK